MANNVAAAPDSGRRFNFNAKTVLPWVALLFPWGMLLAHLSRFWILMPQYEFGWLVPPLALYFFLRRWKALPPSAPAAGQGAAGAALVCALLFLPVWILHEAAPDSPRLNYGLTLLAALFTLAALASRGGWAITKQLAFPVLFIFCAVPWPQRVEAPLIAALTKLVTTVTVEMLQLCGVAAARSGNLVSLSNGVLGVEEACSGIRSFQSLIMAALALGELRRFRAGARVGLVVIGASLAVLLNLLRNFLLAMLAASKGMYAVAVWHDASGWGIFLISFFLLNHAANQLVGMTVAAGGPALSLRPFPRWAGAPLALWFIALLAMTEGWYRLHEKSGTQRLAVHWPEGKSRYQLQPVAQLTKNVLRCSSIQIAGWQEANRSQWTLSSVRWEPREIGSLVAYSHYPEVCLPTAGAKKVRNYPQQRLAIANGELVFTTSQYQISSGPIFSFFTFYEESDQNQKNAWFEQDMSAYGDLARALHGQRDLGKQTLEIVVGGFACYEDALAGVRKALPELARFEPDDSPQ